MAGSLQAQIAKTEQRYAARQETRASTERSLQRGELLRANSDEALRRRLARLGLPPELIDQVGTPGFAPARGLHAESAARTNARAAILERLLGKNDLMPISYLLLGQHRARSVGRIHIRDRSRRRVGFGTGFLVSPQLLMTNNHVLSTAQEASFSEVEFDFEVDLAGNVRQTAEFALDPATFFLTDPSLDFSLVAVASNRQSEREPRDWGWNRLPEGDGLIVTGESVSIIQHPNGEAKQVALRENQVIDLFDAFAHYRTDTAPGSSGSPVFNDQWEVVALHHSGVPKRDAEGHILAVDGQRWQSWMGDHRVHWIANEGTSGTRIVEFVKRATLNGKQAELRDEMLTQEAPMPEGVILPDMPLSPDEPTLPDRPSDRPTSVPGSISLPGHAVTMVGATATWTIPLRVSVNFGSAADLAGPTPAAADAMPPSPVATGIAPGEDAELQQALDELRAARSRAYYDPEADAADRETYYQAIQVDDLSPKALFARLSELLKSTHATTLAYKPSRHVYPWVDLHPDYQLRSIYSGRTFDPEEFIREDLHIEQDRQRALREFLQSESVLGPERLQEQLDLLEAQHPFNCEHVVPQSWFAKREPMRGDLHHLFACESGCNSFRGNIPYYDFPDFEEAVRTACGKREGNRFEPSAGKGAVARATLYFLLRYPGQIDNSAQELEADRITTLLGWHAANPVTEYERHRNQAIFALQGNRNPFIDHPDWANSVRFKLGLG